MRKKNGKKGPVLVILFSVGALAASMAYVITGPYRQLQRPSQEAEAASGGVKDPAPPAEQQVKTDDPKRTQPVVKVTPKFNNGELKFQTSASKARPGTNAYVDVVNDFLEQVPAVPKEARLISVKMEGGVAMLDFSPEFNRTYGTDDERTVVNGVLAALAQFNEIKRVQFLAGGKPIETLGSIDLTEPQEIER